MVKHCRFSIGQARGFTKWIRTSQEILLPRAYSPYETWPGCCTCIRTLSDAGQTWGSLRHIALGVRGDRRFRLEDVDALLKEQQFGPGRGTGKSRRR